MTKSTIARLASGGCLLLAGCAAEHFEEPLDLPAAQAQAAAREVPLLLDFYADWCGACRTFAREAEENTALREALGSVVVFRINAEEGDGVDLADEFSIEGYPTFVVTNDGLQTIQRWSGYGETSEFIARLERAATDPITIEERRARFERAPTAEDAADLGRYHASRDEHLEAISYLRDAAERGDPADRYDYDLFMAQARAAYDGVVKPAEVKATADRLMESPDLSLTSSLLIARAMSKLAPRAEGWTAAPYIEAALAASEGDRTAEVEEARQELLIAQALQITGDTERALELKKATLPEGWEDDPEELNGLAWWCFENEIDLENAEALARKGAALETDAGQKALILDTVAEICFLRGDPEGALEAIRQAIEADPENSYYQHQLVRFDGSTAPFL